MAKRSCFSSNIYCDGSQMQHHDHLIHEAERMVNKLMIASYLLVNQLVWIFRDEIIAIKNPEIIIDFGYFAYF